MFHSTELNRKINHIHEKSLRIAYRDYNSSVNDLLKKEKSVCNLRSQRDFFHKYHQYHKIWFEFIKRFCIKNLEHDTCRKSASDEMLKIK